MGYVPDNWTHRAKFYAGPELMREMWWVGQPSFDMDMQIIRENATYTRVDWWTPDGEHGVVYGKATPSSSRGLPTDDERRVAHAAWDAESRAELLADPPEGFAAHEAEFKKWHPKETFDPLSWNRMSFGDQAYYARGGRRTPDEWMPGGGTGNESPLATMAKALSLTPSPSIISGYRVWAYDLLDWLDRQGWKLERK